MIREMSINDISLILKIEQELFSDAWSKKEYEYEINDNEFSKTYILEEDKVIIGFAVEYFLFERAEIATIAIDPKYQKQGYGLNLLKYLIKEAIKEGCEIISLEVRVSNEKAINLYKKIGFESIRIRKSYYSDNFEDAYEMAMNIGGLNEEDICD